MAYLRVGEPAVRRLNYHPARSLKTRRTRTRGGNRRDQRDCQSREAGKNWAYRIDPGQSFALNRTVLVGLEPQIAEVDFPCAFELWSDAAFHLAASGIVVDSESDQMPV